jgi:reactive intermediate/imine deaminase
MARLEGRTSLAPEPDSPYSQAIRIGSTVAVAGQVGLDPKTGELAGRDVGAQTVQAFRNVAAVLAASGASLDDIIRVDVYLSTMSDFEAMNEQYVHVFSLPYPTRTTVGVELPEGLKVEITVLAVQN